MPSNDWKLELQKVAAVEDPKNLLPTVRLWHTENTVAIFDKFPKSKYHFLLLPRLTTYWTTWRLHSLRGLFRGDKEAGRNLLLELKDESEQVVKMMKDEMVRMTFFDREISVKTSILRNPLVILACS